MPVSSTFHPREPHPNLLEESMIKAIATLVVLLLAATLIYAATRPDTFHVERAVSIKAPPEKIYPLINDFHQWEAWTPYNKDPAMKKTFSGNVSGPGAGYAWQGNGEVGQGNIEITQSLAPTKIGLDLHMIKPFEGHNQVEFTLASASDTTTVTWAMHGTQAYIAKVMGLFFNMDKMVGKDFEVGLANLKAVAEK
jgi:hypothetical protein